MVTQFCNPTQTYDRIKNIGFEVGILSVILGKCKNHVLYEVVLESQTFIYYIVWYFVSKDCGQKARAFKRIRYKPTATFWLLQG